MVALSAFIKNPSNIGYDGEDSDEKILYVIRRSHLTNILWILGLAIMSVIPFIVDPYISNLQVGGEVLVGTQFIFMLTLFWYLVIFGLFLFNFFNWFFNVYIISTKKIVDFDFFGLTYKNISETTLQNVQDVTAKISGPIHMIFNIGDVFIQTAAEHREFDFALVDDPGKLRDIISDLVASKEHHGGHK